MNTGTYFLCDVNQAFVFLGKIVLPGDRKNERVKVRLIVFLWLLHCAIHMFLIMVGLSKKVITQVSVLSIFDMIICITWITTNKN